MVGLSHSPRISPHALVVGGTGMLRSVSLALVQQGYEVSVIARNKDQLAELQREAIEGQIHPLALDYRYTSLLITSIEEAIDLLGPIELAVVWIHSAAPDAPLTIARLCGKPENPCQYFDILGSTSVNPSRAELSQRKQFAALPNIQYHEIILGFMRELRGSRWLTDQEISQGVLQAIAQEQSQFIVGTVEPWSAPP